MATVHQQLEQLLAIIEGYKIRVAELETQIVKLEAENIRLLTNIDYLDPDGSKSPATFWEGM